MKKSKDLVSAKAWIKLKQLSKSEKLDLRNLFVKDKNRIDYLFTNLAGINFDFSKSMINKKILTSLLTLTKERKVRSHYTELISGEKINKTEDRVVGHLWLRSRDLLPNQEKRSAEIDSTQTSFLNFATNIRNGNIFGYTGKKFTNVVNVGIGGSTLGPEMICHALSNNYDSQLNYYFVSNIDSFEIEKIINSLDPETTLFVITSKSFTTIETLANANQARIWIQERLGKNAISNHFIAVSTAVEKCLEFGISEERIFPVWDWVGGRFSVLSSVGITIAITYGPEIFLEIQKGAADFDKQLLVSPDDTNPSLLHAVINIWNMNFMNYSALAVIPYSSALEKFPSYLQQLWMESNGKSVDIDGNSVKVRTAPVVFGEAGTNSQHSFFQMLHQGSDVIPTDFITVKRNKGKLKDFADNLMSNAIAQSAVLAFGKNKKELIAEKTSRDLIKHKEMKGNRPSITIMLPELKAEIIGKLVAFYETSVIYQGFILGINSFDQWGVELGKENAITVKNRINGDNSKFDSSTEKQISEYLKDI